MICPECNGRGETIYYIETDRDENTVTVTQRKRICRTCNGSGKKPMTNADRIRSMTDQELAVFLSMDLKEPCDYCQLAVFDGACTETLCEDAMMKWLQQPAEGD